MIQIIIKIFAISVVFGVICTMIYDSCKSESIKEYMDGGRWACAIIITLCFMALPIALFIKLVH